MNKIFHIGSTFKAFNEGEDLIIAGMASTNNTDRVGDIIETEAWTKGGLDNFLNNPVILFNHDYNQPIGRAVSLGTNDNGLQLQAKIAKSAGHVGDLIKEGVLGAFSVGFRVKDAEFMTESDGYRIKDAELLEVSVVTVPANQAATFSLAKSFDSERDYEEFKKSFKINDSEEKHVLNVRETEDTDEKHSDESMPKDLSQVEAQEKTMSDNIDIDAIVAAAVEKTAATMAMKDAERKAEERANMEAEQKAAAEAEAQKAAEEQRIAAAVTSGAEKLMADVEAKLAAKDADYEKVIGELQSELVEKSEEIKNIRESKRVFADRGEAKSFAETYEAELVDAHLLGVITQKGWDNKLARELFEKASRNTNTGVSVPDTSGDALQAFETTVAAAMERDVELELVLDPMFRKVQMNSASMVLPTMPDAGYAEFAANGTDGGAQGTPFAGNLEDRDAAVGSPFPGMSMGKKVLTVERLISRSYISNETEEDAIIPVLPFIRESMVRAHARSIEHSLLLGQSSDDLISSAYAGLVQLTNGSATLDNASSPDAGGVATASKLLDLRQAMGKYGRRAGDVVYIVGLTAYYDMLDDPDFQNINEVGDQRATKITGEIGNVFGTPVVVCDEFPGGRTDGKPWAVAVNARNFVVPVLRGATVETDYDVENQRRVLVATQRRGFDVIFADDATAGDFQTAVHTW